MTFRMSRTTPASTKTQKNQCFFEGVADALPQIDIFWPPPPPPELFLTLGKVKCHRHFFGGEEEGFKSQTDESPTLAKVKVSVECNGASARCNMLRSSTRSSACLALCFSCQDRARIAAWLKYFEIVFTCGDTDHHERVRVLPPLFLQHGSSIALFRLGIGVLFWFSISVPRPVAVHCLCS